MDGGRAAVERAKLEVDLPAAAGGPDDVREGGQGGRVGGDQPVGEFPGDRVRDVAARPRPGVGRRPVGVGSSMSGTSRAGSKTRADSDSESSDTRPVPSGFWTFLSPPAVWLPRRDCATGLNRLTRTRPAQRG